MDTCIIVHCHLPESATCVTVVLRAIVNLTPREKSISLLFHVACHLCITDSKLVLFSADNYWGEGECLSLA